uniref:F-box protein 21 n=1 Tax=Leptobrachium leishanense TaxID=445787 RepID=A0A8C5LL61_9ANUR
MAASSPEGSSLCLGDSAASPVDGMEPPPGPVLAHLPGELLEQILCSGGLDYRDIIGLGCTCRRLRELCVGRGKVWRRQLRDRWPSMMKYYNQTDSYDWLEEFKTRHKAGLAVHKLLVDFSRRFITERNIPCEFNELESFGYPAYFLEDELLIIINNESKKCSVLQYCAKKILCSMRQEATLRDLKALLQHPSGNHQILEGAPSPIEDLDLQEQALDALNHVLFVDMKFKGNVTDYYNPLNSYIHQVLITKTGIPISLSVLYLYLAEQLGVLLEPVNFPHHFMLRWSQGHRGSVNISDYAYVDVFGGGKRLTARDCAYVIGLYVTEEFYAAVGTKEVMQRMIGNLLNLGKRESKDRNFMLLRVSLDLYLTMYPDSVQHLLLQARLYFHLGIWPEKVLDILQNIQALDPSQHGAVAYLIQHTLEHIAKRKEDGVPNIKLRSTESEVCYSIGLIMRHKRHGYRGVIFGWDPICMMPPDWIENLDTENLTNGANQPFYSILSDDGYYTYIEQEHLELHPSPEQMLHPDIQLYFSEFTGTHYIGNEELKIQYPEDMEFTLDCIQHSLDGQCSASQQ